MLKSIQIQNFRVLNQLTLPDLRRINLIAGLNSCGKTSLLEAVFLLSGAGNAQLFIHPNALRGMIPNFGIRASSEIPWREIFSNLNILKTIEIAGEHEEFGELKLEIALEKSLHEEIQIEKNRKELIPSNLETSMQSRIPITNNPAMPALNLRYFRGKTLQTESRIRPSAQGVEISQPIANPPFIASYVSANTGSYEEDAHRLGLLRRKKMGNLLLKSLNVIEPELQSIEESSVTGVSMIYGDVGLHELIPLSVMGDGISRIARLILAISSTPGGVVLVDEIENSLHHTVLPNVWKAIDEATSTFNVQLISTTHSLENIEAAHSVLNQGYFRLHRLESNSGTSRCVTYVPESIEAAMKHGMAVR